MSTATLVLTHKKRPVKIVERARVRTWQRYTIMGAEFGFPMASIHEESTKRLPPKKGYRMRTAEAWFVKIAYEDNPAEQAWVSKDVVANYGCRSLPKAERDAYRALPLVSMPEIGSFR